MSFDYEILVDITERTNALVHTAKMKIEFRMVL